MLTSIDRATTLFVIDFSNLAFISFHSKVGGGDFIGTFIQKLLSIEAKLGNGMNSAFVFAYDNFDVEKRELYANYKSNRVKMEFDPRPELKKLVQYLRGSAIQSKGHEADDVIHTFICKHPNKKIYIITTDMDLCQCCVKKNVKIFNPIKMKIVNLLDLRTKYGIADWIHIALWKTVFGDPSDNIKPAVARTPKKLFVPLINSTDGTIEDFYKKLEDEYINNGLKDIWYKQFIESKSTLENNWRIIKLKPELELEIETTEGHRGFFKAFITKRGCGHLFNPILTGSRS